MSERNYKGPKYPTEAHSSIPAFNSYEEEAELWDTHDFTDFKQEATRSCREFKHEDTKIQRHKDY